MAARDDTTAVKKGFRLGNKTRKEPDLTAETKAPASASEPWREPDLGASGSMSSSFAEEASLAEENSQDTAGSGSAPGAVLSASELIESVPPAKSWNVIPSMVDFEDPLVRCLSMLAGLLQRPISSEALKAGLPHANEAFTPELAVRAAERAGLSARIVRRPHLTRILPVTLPCILLLKGGTCCVLQNVSRSQADILLPEAGGTSKTVAVAELQEQYTGYALFACSEARFDERAPDTKLSKTRAWFWGTLWQFGSLY